MKKIKEIWNDWKIYIINGFITMILVVIGTSNDNIGNIVEIVCLVIFGILIISFVSTVSYFIIRKNLLLKKIDSKDLNTVKKYAEKRYFKLDVLEKIDESNSFEFCLCDEFDAIYDMANMFGEYKKLNDSKDNILTIEFIKYVKKLNNEEVNKILKDSMKIKEIIFKYYDSNGIWKK